MPYISPGLLLAALRILLATLRIKFLDIEFYTCFAALFFVSYKQNYTKRGLISASIGTLGIKTRRK